MTLDEINEAHAAGELEYQPGGPTFWAKWVRWAGSAVDRETAGVFEFRRRPVGAGTLGWSDFASAANAASAFSAAKEFAELSSGRPVALGTGNVFVNAHPTAPELLAAAAKHMEDRAKTYDQPGGERNMAHTVEAFNAITGRDLSESEGWLFMEQLKAVRDYRTPGGHADSQEDRIAYAALGAEARRAGR